MRSTSPFGSLLVLTAGDHSWKFLIVLFTLTRQDAFQHHLTIFIKHKLSSLIMSQPTQQQQGRTYFQEQEHVPRAHSGQGIGDGGLRYVFSSHLLWMDLAQPLGTAGAQGPHTACYCFLPQHRHSHSSDSCHTPYFLNCTVPSAILQEERTKSLATIQAVVLQKLQPKGLPSPPPPIPFLLEQMENRTSDNTRSYTERGVETYAHLLSGTADEAQAVWDHHATQCLQSSQALSPLSLERNHPLAVPCHRPFSHEPAVPQLPDRGPTLSGSSPLCPYWK